MPLFSERYGYTKPSDVFIREQISPEIQNAICSCYDDLPNLFDKSGKYTNGVVCYEELELHLWTEFLKQRKQNFYEPALYGRNHKTVATNFLEDPGKEWYEKLNLIEETIEFIYCIDSKYEPNFYVTNTFIRMLNAKFKRLNFAYRIVGGKIVEIISEEEIKEIEDALKASSDNIRIHLSSALKLYSKRPDADYRNSIKESISAVEAYCREKTGKNTLGDALNTLEANGIVLPKLLKVSFEKLYAYTNHPDTGIRHALMDDEGTYTPKAEEAAFMMVACSAFINYLRKK